MKKFLFIVAMMLCCATTIFAQNNKISYQAVVRDTENKLVANKTVTVTVNIFNGEETTAVYSETHENVQTNVNGLISLLIGPDQTDDAWNSIQWANARVETTVTLAGTSLGTLKMPLTAVPYALYADEINPAGTVVTNIYNKMQRDSVALAEKMRADSTVIRNALSDSTSAVRSALVDSTSAVRDALVDSTSAVRSALVDSTSAVRTALVDSVTNINTRVETTAETLHNKINILETNVTNRMNTISDSVKTTLDSVTTVSTNLHSEITAVSTDMQTNYAKLAGANTFTGNNTFSGNNTFTGTVTAGTVNASSVTVTCGENVTADVCDLLQKINTLEQKINNPQTLLDLVNEMTDAQKDQLKRALGVYVADSVSLNKSATTITTGGSEVLVVKVWPDTIAQDVQWTSSNEQVAKVSDGVVHAIAPGQAVIKATSLSTPSHYATCTVTVVNPQLNALFNLKRNDDGSWEVTMPTDDLEVEIEVYNE